MMATSKMKIKFGYIRIFTFQWKNGQFQIQTCPDFNLSMDNFKSGQVRLSIFQFLNLQSGHILISILEPSRFQFSIVKFQIWTFPDFNSGPQILTCWVTVWYGKSELLARACGFRAVDCWQWRSGHYNLKFFPSIFFRFPPSLPFFIEGVLGSKNLFSESCLECPKT